MNIFNVKNSIFIKKPLSDFNVSLNTNNVKVHCIDQTTHLTHVVVVGDVHECVKELRSLLNRFKHFCAEKTNYYLNGDWLDKGNDTEDTISFLKEFVKLPNCFLIKGNHDKHLKQSFLDKHFIDVRDYLELKTTKGKFILSHSFTERDARGRRPRSCFKY